MSESDELRKVIHWHMQAMARQVLCSAFLRRAREGLTIADLAKRLDWHEASVRGVLKGIQDISLEDLGAISHALGFYLDFHLIPWEGMASQDAGDESAEKERQP